MYALSVTFCEIITYELLKCYLFESVTFKEESQDYEIKKSTITSLDVNLYVLRFSDKIADLSQTVFVKFTNEANFKPESWSFNAWRLLIMMNYLTYLSRYTKYSQTDY